MQMVSTLVLIYSGRPPLRHTIETNRMTFQTVDQEICLISILTGAKGLGLASPPKLGYDFSTKIFLIYYILLTEKVSLFR